MNEYEVVYRADSGLDPSPIRETMDGESALSVAKSAAEAVDESVAVEAVLDGEVRGGRCVGVDAMGGAMVAERRENGGLESFASCQTDQKSPGASRSGLSPSIRRTGFRVAGG